MHPLLLFTLFFISGNFPTSLSSSVKRNLEYLDGTYPLRENIGQDKTKQSQLNLPGNAIIKNNGNEQTVFIPLNSGSNKGFIKYYTSYNNPSHKYPNTVFVKSFYQKSVTPTYNNGYSIPKPNTKPLINNKNPYFYKTSYTRSVPLQTVQNIGNSNKEGFAKNSKPFKQEYNKSHASKSVTSFKTKENFNSEKNSKGKNRAWDEPDSYFFNDDTFGYVFDDFSIENEKINAERNKNSKKVKNNQGTETIDDIKSISSQNKRKNDDSDSKEKSDDEFNNSKKSEVKFKLNIHNVIRKPLTNKDNESLTNRKTEDGTKYFNDKLKLSLTPATTTSTITPLQIPRNELEGVTEQYIPLSTTTEPPRDNKQDSHVPLHKPKQDPYPSFITKLIEPLMNNLRNML